MPARQAPPVSNVHESRESWLRAATNELRPHFEQCGYPLPDKFRFAIAFTSNGRKSKQPGELWHAETSADQHYELFIRADLSDPVEVLGVLIHELVHAVLPLDAGHGRLYKEAALKIGLHGPMRQAMPGPLLQPRVNELAAALGPLPHAKLNIERGPSNKGPIDRPKKQGTRMIKAECGAADCQYTVRIARKWLTELGAPLCPKHGLMKFDLPAEGEEPAGAV